MRLFGDDVSIAQWPHSSSHPPHDEQGCLVVVSPLVTFMVLTSADSMNTLIDHSRTDPPAAIAPPPFAGRAAAC
jgi:hypothetical protein